MSYQLTCPKCKHEFRYSNDYIDHNIAKLGLEIKDIMDQLAEHKKLPYSEQRSRTEWWLNAKKALDIKTKEVTKLKAIRKSASQITTQYKYDLLKSFVKEQLGEEEYMKLIRKVEDELRAYSESNLMQHEYTRSNSKSNVTSINKL